MNLVHTFSIRVPEEATQAVSQALHSRHGRGPGQKLRRTVLDARTSRPMRTFAQVTITEPGETTSVRSITVELKVDFVAWLLEVNGFTDNVFSRPASSLTPWFRDWLPWMLQGLDAQIMDHFTEDHFQLDSFACQYLFNAGSSTEAFRWYMHFLQHCKVVLDSGRPYPGAKKSAAPRRAKVRLSEDVRQSFTVDLEHLPFGETFGQATISLLVDKEDFPRGFAVSEAKDPKLLRSKASELLCVVVTVDVSKRMHVGGDTDTQLPRDFRQWTRENLRDDPFKLIWDAVRYALWLNLVMPTSAEQIDRSGFSSAVNELLNLYLEDGNLRQSVWVSNDVDEERFRGRLIKEAGVDILTPWAFAQLNQSGFLGDRLRYEQRFVPDGDPDLAPHTLSALNIQDRLQKFQEDLARDADLRAKQPWLNRPEASAD